MANSDTTLTEKESRGEPDGNSLYYYQLWMQAQTENRALRQALTWCVVNDGETLFDHPNLLQRFRQILALEDQDE